jgi:hypothetical protein
VPNPCRPSANLKERGWTGEAPQRLMNLKNASLLALFGMILLTVVVVADLIRDLAGVVRGIVATGVLLRSVIYTFASVVLTVFLFVFYKRQS